MPTQIATVPVTGSWYRHVPADASPMPTPGHTPGNGRWQRGEQLAGLYVAQDPDTVWAEWYRALAELAQAPEERLPRDLWRFTLNLQRVADLTRAAALGSLGLPDLLPDRSQWPAFQDVGHRLAAEGFAGVLFRSSARPDGLCVCVFATDQGFVGVRATGSPKRITPAPVVPRGMRT